MRRIFKSQHLANCWDDGAAAGMSESEKLLYRSNLLGSDNEGAMADPFVYDASNIDRFKDIF